MIDDWEATPHLRYYLRASRGKTMRGSITKPRQQQLWINRKTKEFDWRRIPTDLESAPHYAAEVSFEGENLIVRRTRRTTLP